MNRCPNCQEECDDQFDVCWNCQYSFTEQRILGNADLKVICPRCKRQTQATNRYCPNCQYEFEPGVFPVSAADDRNMTLDCLRCQVPMFLKGKFKFHAGTHLGPIESPMEMWLNRAFFDLYFCPKCGKVEFFLPEKGNHGDETAG